jgi:hypothetical protein
MIPDWLWPAIAVACLLVVAWHDEHRMKRSVENFRAVEAERIARQQTAPLGNVSRYYE